MERMHASHVAALNPLSGDHSGNDAPSAEDNDADLKKLIHAIVNEFGGDTSAYFESLKRRSAGVQTARSIDEQTRIAQLFVKSIQEK